MKDTDNLNYKQAVKKLAESINREGQITGLNGINRGPAFLTDVIYEAVSMSAHGDNEHTKKAAIKRVAALLTLD